MESVLKPSPEDISALITKIEKLKQEIEKFRKKSFLTLMQKMALSHTADVSRLIFNLSEKDKREHFYNDDIPIHWKPNQRGRFILIDKEIELFDPEQHSKRSSYDRMELDREQLVDFIKIRQREKRKHYWQTEIQPLKDQLDIDLTPWLPYMRPYVSVEETKEAVTTAEPERLAKAKREMEKVLRVLETEAVKLADDNTTTAIKMNLKPSDIDKIISLAQKMTTVARKGQSKSVLSSLQNQLSNFIRP